MSQNFCSIVGRVTSFKASKTASGKDAMHIYVTTIERFGEEPRPQSHRVSVFGSEVLPVSELIEIGCGITVMGRMRPDLGDVVSSCTRIHAERRSV